MNNCFWLLNSYVSIYINKWRNKWIDVYRFLAILHISLPLFLFDFILIQYPTYHYDFTTFLLFYLYYKLFQRISHVTALRNLQPTYFFNLLDYPMIFHLQKTSLTFKVTHIYILYMIYKHYVLMSNAYILILMEFNQQLWIIHSCFSNLYHSDSQVVFEYISEYCSHTVDISLAYPFYRNVQCIYTDIELYWKPLSA